MRATLYAVGALLFLAYPLVILCAVARNIDQPGTRPEPAAITLGSHSASHIVERDATRSSYGGLRNTTLRKFGN